MMFRGKIKRLHFIGIGGSGMSGIAEVLLNLGFAVSGSDLKAGEVVKRLRELGADIAIGHRPENLGDADVVVRSTAVPDDNPEVVAAISRFIPVIPRAEMLAELMRMKYGIAIGGTHGKTTTTSMVARTLAEAGLDPTIVIGGRLDAIGSNAKLGFGDYLVAEADESDGSFLLLSPTVAVITNIDPEHLDYYRDYAAIQDAFVRFANGVPFFGYAVVCLDHPGVQQLIPAFRKRVVTYGLSRQSDFRAEDIRRDGLITAFTAFHRQEVLGEVALGMPGVHNVLNALACIATARGLDIPFEAIARALHHFTGVDRRFTLRGESKGVLVVDDYGHHPVEIQATLTAASEAYPHRRLVAVFQPHRYTRVRDLGEAFCRAFNRADVVLVCPIYAAGEAPLPGVDHHRLADGMRAQGHRQVVIAHDLDDALTHLTSHVRLGDVVVTLGAGNVNQLCGSLLSFLGKPDVFI